MGESAAREHRKRKTVGLMPGKRIYRKLTLFPRKDCLRRSENLFLSFGTPLRHAIEGCDSNR